MTRLSICIATFKRGDYIGETLASIVPQLTDAVEVVILDGASPDDTAAVVARYAEGRGNVRYIRAETNSGVDADFDLAVEHARGEHCWLFTDDDVLLPGAVRAVLDELADGDPDVLVVDAEVRDINLDRRFEPARLRIAARRDYPPEDRDAFMADAADALSFIGCAVVRRSFWRSRDRQTYYGSLFVHVGVIFQSPPPRLARVRPGALIAIRMGNAMWSRRAFEIWLFKWPALIWSFPDYSAEAKARAVPREPWRGFRNLLTYRAYGSFTGEDYRQFLAGRASFGSRLGARLLLATPGPLVHFLVVAKFAAARAAANSVTYNLLIASRNAGAASRALGRAMGYSLGPRTPRG